jgi:hypothetical protein
MISSQALGVVAQNTTVGGTVEQHGGGGGFTCDPSGVFAAFGSPVFSTYEDSSDWGNLDISNVSSCWMGINIGGNASCANTSSRTRMRSRSSSTTFMGT